ncbi:MAG TPA: archease [Acidimicrobiia bacterium]|nr:archease [Acidimicrobiia bacterium]
MTYRVLSHTADTGIEATGHTLAELIEVLSQGMFELMARCDPSADRRRLTLRVDAPTIEDLVVDILSELLFRSETEDLLFCQFRVTLEPGVPAATVETAGIPVHEVEPTGPPIKAVTYHDLVVEQRESQWYGRVYFDV